MVPWDFTMENSMVISGDLVRIYGDDIHGFMVDFTWDFTIKDIQN
jgi:hypothetical protein